MNPTLIFLDCAPSTAKHLAILFRMACCNVIILLSIEGRSDYWLGMNNRNDAGRSYYGVITVLCCDEI
jgi:hypothetical protein